eukprot:SAG22_NODE_3848_length_1504_cov_0.977936_1_plen_83_part_10
MLPSVAAVTPTATQTPVVAASSSTSTVPARARAVAPAESGGCSTHRSVSLGSLWSSTEPTYSGGWAQLPAAGGDGGVAGGVAG